MNDRPAPPAVRPLLAFALIALCLSLSSCLCSWRPDVGPVEEEESVASIEDLELHSKDTSIGEATRSRSVRADIEDWSRYDDRFAISNR